MFQHRDEKVSFRYRIYQSAQQVRVSGGGNAVSEIKDVIRTTASTTHHLWAHSPYPTIENLYDIGTRLELCQSAP